MKFTDAMTSHDSLTENGAVTHSTSGAANLDLFFQIGAMRGREDRVIEDAFTAALGENPLMAMKIAFYNRDIRGGQGERRTFRVIMNYLAAYHPELVRKNMHLIPEYGRWDDLLVFADTDLEDDAFTLIRTALNDGNGLCAKWMPREKSSKSALAGKLRRFLDMSPRSYRKMLSRLTKVVESQMCSGDWEGIEYSHVPSVAMKNYRKAFARQTPARWEEYLSALESGNSDVKINASAIFPHDIIKNFLYGYGNPDRQEVRAAEAQWQALPDFMGDNSGKVLVMADVSGSMSTGLNEHLTPMQASVSLALYCAERAKGPFKDLYISFSTNSEFVQLRGSNIAEKIRNIRTTNVGYSTDLNRAFAVMLQRAVDHNVDQDDMPETLLIVSDMQFDSHDVGGASTNFEAIREQYRAAGYTMPNIVFWNVNARGGSPIKQNDQGVALVSGFNPSILTAILGGEMAPMAVLDRAINNGRYDAVTI